MKGKKTDKGRYPRKRIKFELKNMPVQAVIWLAPVGLCAIA